MGLLTPRSVGLFGKSPLDSKPKAYSLLTPVIWDRVRGQGRLPSEGGGGGRGEMPVRMTNPAPQKQEWTPKWEEPPFSRGTARTTTPAGSEVTFHRYGDTATVEFWNVHPRGAPMTSSSRSTARGLGRLEDVYRAVKSYVQTYKPREIKFSGATDAHDKVYSKVAPKMAKELGGEYMRSGSYFKIILPTLD